MQTLFILHDPPYGSERPYNALRLATALLRRSGGQVRLFLLADAVGCAKDGQSVPNGYYNLGRMMELAIKAGANVAVCGTCMDARGVNDGELLPGVHRGTMELLAEWTNEADKVLTW
jgi:uncharacterized protein involved in oxidation of intracellular sulfur